MNITFSRLTTPTPEIVASIHKWANDPAIIPFIRPNPTEESLNNKEIVTIESLTKRLEYTHIYLIYAESRLVGEISFQVDPDQLHKKTPGSAWIGINIGEEFARGKGIGTRAMQYLEQQIKAHGLHRIELGVFEFNANAIKLYKKMGYQEIARIDRFTFWQGKMWQDIRMEKLLG